MARDATAYNYPSFAPSHYRFGALAGPAVGRIARRHRVRTLAGVPVDLAPRAGRPMVLETGSITCPLYQRNVGAMQALARTYPGFDFVVLYTREAHPGERAPAHRCVADKLGAAARVRTRDGEVRPILVDGIGGTAHRALGGHPNMVYVLDHNGVVGFRAEANDPAALARALDRLARGHDTRGVVAEFVPPRPLATLKVLRRAGWRALAYFVRSLPALAWHRYFARAAARRKN